MGLATAIDDVTVKFVPDQFEFWNLDGRHRIEWDSIQLGERLKTFNNRVQCLIACMFARDVLHIFEKQYPKDGRPRKAIETTEALVEEQWSRGQCPNCLSHPVARAAANDAANAARAAANDAANATDAYATYAAYAAAANAANAAAYPASAAAYPACAAIYAVRAASVVANTAEAADAVKIRHNCLLALFANRPFDPKWKTSDVVDVARAIYEDKAFERMPILADALMDAGCDDETLLTHMQQLDSSWWYRGCFVLDAILDKRC